MRRLSITELLKTTAAFAVVSSVTIDAGLLLWDRSSREVDIPGEWYINGPLLALVAVGTPATINLAGRMMGLIGNDRPGRIWGFQEATLSPLINKIAFWTNGKQGAMYAHTTPLIFGASLPTEAETERLGDYRPAVWRVPLGSETVVSVRESELRAFLDVAWKRDKYQFSRRYWTRSRRPPIWRGKYDAYMRLLQEAGLVEGRHSQGGASGRLVTFPREAITYLKYESQFRTH